MHDWTMISRGAAVAAALLAGPGVAVADFAGAAKAAGDPWAWADPLSDADLAGLRGTGAGFDLTATFVVTDSASARFDVSGAVLPASVNGTPDVSRLGSGQVQVSAQLSGLAGFNGIGTFVSVNGDHNVTATNTTVNILYAPNTAAQTALTLFRQVPFGS